MTDQTSKSAGVSRRTLIQGAAWSAPVIAAAIATPLAAASGIEAGDFALNGSCGIPDGVQDPGFTLRADDFALPAGTTIAVTGGGGVADLGTFTVAGASATVDAPSALSRTIVLTAPLAAGTTMEARTTLSNVDLFTMSATVTLPDGYTVGPDAKVTGSVDWARPACTAG